MKTFIAHSDLLDHLTSEGLSANLFVGVTDDPESLVDDLRTGRAFSEATDGRSPHPKAPFVLCNDWKIIAKYDNVGRSTESWVRHLGSFCCGHEDYAETDLALRTLSALSDDMPENLYLPTRGIDQLICLNHWSFQYAMRNHCSDRAERNAYKSAYIKNFLDHMMVYTIAVS